jgi:uncharacterized protein (DUF58 family)
MDTREILKRVRRIAIRTNRLVNESLAGQYHSVFKGRGMEFSEVREYILGDDIRTIDWNVTSRMGSLHVKKFVEERELTVVLVLDASGSGEFGTGNRFKREMAAEVCAMLAFSAINNNDRVGLIIFTDTIELYVPPRKGPNHALRVVREALFFEPRHRGTDLRQALEYLVRVIRKKSVVFLISDFLGHDFDRGLRVANQKHDLIAVRILDPREGDLPDVGWIELEDAETGETILVDSSRPRFRRAFTRCAGEREEDLLQRLKAMKVDTISLRTDRPYDRPLISFFEKRARRMR